MLLGEGALGGPDAAVLGEGDVQAVVVPPAGEDEEGDGQDGHEEDVEDAEVDEAGGDADDVAGVGDAEGDGVVEPEEVGPGGQGEVVGAGGADVEAAEAAAALEEGAEGQEGPGEGAEGVEAPLVGGGGVGREEVGQDPGPGQGDVVADGSPRDAGDEAEGDGHDGERHDPVDKLGEEDLAVTVLGLVDLGDHIPCEVRGEGVVGDGTGEESDGEEVVEDLLARAGDEGQAKEDELPWRVSLTPSHDAGRRGRGGGTTHEFEDEDSSNSPQPVGAMGGERLLACRRVDLQSLVGPCEEGVHLDGFGII